MSQILSFLGIKEKEQPFEELISPHMSNLFKVAYQYTGTKHDAEDLLQDLLEYLYSKQAELRKVEKLKPWLMRCLYNRFVDMYRKKQRQPNLEDIDDEKVQPLFRHFDSHHKDELNQEVMTAISKLSPEHRALVTLHDINGYTLPELSKIMGIPLGTLKSTLHRIRGQLKQHITLQPHELNVRHY